LTFETCPEYKKGGGFMKTLIVYFSLSGNCAYITDLIKSETGADVIRLETVDEKKREGFAKYFHGGRQTLFHAKPALKPYEVSVEKYDLIIIGTPVWAGSPVPALNTFLSETKISGKRLAFFCCCMGGKGKTLDKLKDAFKGNTFAGETDFINPLKGNREEITLRIREWVKQITP
jgi:flavodoxin